MKRDFSDITGYRKFLNSLNFLGCCAILYGRMIRPLLAGSISICQSPLAISRFEKYFAPFSLSKTSLITGRHLVIDTYGIQATTVEDHTFSSVFLSNQSLEMPMDEYFPERVFSNFLFQSEFSCRKTLSFYFKNYTVILLCLCNNFAKYYKNQLTGL